MKLIGKTVYFYHDGFRSGRIVKETRSRRGGLKSITIRLPSYDLTKHKHRYNGRKVRLTQKNFPAARECGVVFRSKFIPLTFEETHANNPKKEKVAPRKKVRHRASLPSPEAPPQAAD